MPESLIKNYGLRWHASRVVWTGRTVDVGLWGVPSRERKSTPVNFADQVAIYVLYDGETPIYVGQSGVRDNRLMSRLRNHRADRLADRWDRFSWFGLCGVLPSGKLTPVATEQKIGPAEVLNQIEGVIVEAVEPRQNRQGGQFGVGVRRYLQYPDARNEMSDKSLLKELHAAIMRNQS